jgi:hypothetical protein
MPPIKPPDPEGGKMFTFNGSSNMGLYADSVIARWFCPVTVWKVRPGQR